MAPWPQENATNGSMRHSYMHMQTGAATDAATTATATATATQRLQSTATARAASRATNCHDNTRHSSPPPPPAIPLARNVRPSVTGHGTAGTSKVSVCCRVVARARDGVSCGFAGFVRCVRCCVRWLLFASFFCVRAATQHGRTNGRCCHVVHHNATLQQM